LVLQSPVVVPDKEEEEPTFAEKVAAARAGVERLMGGGPMLSSLELLAAGRGAKVFGLMAERNPGGAVQVDRQGPTGKISPFQFQVDEAGCVGALCGACIQVCPQDAIVMVIPEDRQAAVAATLEEAGRREPGRGALRVGGTFARISLGCDGCFACVAACMEAGDVVTITGVPRAELQRLRLRLYPAPEQPDKGGYK
jgi:ferredoxin